MRSIPNKLLAHFKSLIRCDIIRHIPVYGGDINNSYCLVCKDRKVFVKINEYPHGLRMLQSEADSLQLLQKANCIPIPRYRFCQQYESFSFLLLDFIPEGRKTIVSFPDFGRNLAKLHRCSSTEFGQHTNNYIGKLEQSNHSSRKWSEFYGSQRIMPQIKISSHLGFFTNLEVEKWIHFIEKVSDYFPIEPPSLVHGDLWNGNYLIDLNGNVWLIDPASYFGHREMDLAMTKLFGGFPTEFYESYQEEYPLSEGFHDRVDLYQLYYLLAHLNMFGKGYYPQVMRIFKKYY